MKKGFIYNFIKVADDLVDAIGKLDGYLDRESLEWKLMRSAGFDPRQIYNGYKNLEKRGLIKNHGNNFKFTSAGVKWYKNSHFKYFRNKSKKWDGKWRIIIFDIPQELHRERNILRRRLRSMGFYMLQKSVFIFPY